MPSPDKIANYLEIIRQQIRWPRAQAVVLEEIAAHLSDQKSAFLEQGLDEASATEQAIREMGDPVTVGRQLDQVHRPQTDWFLLALTSGLLFLGLLIRFSIDFTLDGSPPLTSQLIWAGIAAIAMLAAYFADFTLIGKYPQAIFFCLCAIVLAAYLFTGSINGIYRYAIYPLLFFPIAFAGLVYRLRGQSYGGLLRSGAAFAVAACLCLMIPSLSMLFLLGTSCLIILTAAVLKGCFQVKKLRAILIMYIPAALVTVMGLGLTLISAGYRGDRLRAAFNPFTDPNGMGYIGATIQNLLSRAQLIGGGQALDYPGLSVEAANLLNAQILPSINTDFLLTYLTYRFGWLAFLAVTLLLLVFVIRSIKLCKKQNNLLGFLTAIAILSTFTLQLLIYVAANLGFVLFSPLSLPLISYGNIFLVINMLLIGFMLSIFRTGYLVRDKIHFNMD